jgi:hypothetical protein
MAAPAEFVEILRNLQSNDTATLTAAEKCFEEAKEKQPAQTVVALFEVLAQQQLDEPIREQACVLLRQCFGKATDDASAWMQLGGSGQVQCTANLLKLLEGESNGKVRRKIADALQFLGNQLIKIPEESRPTNVEVWPDLMPTLMRLITDGTKDAGIRADALWTVKELQISLWQVMVANSQQTAQVIQGCLGDTALTVRSEAAILLCEFAEKLETKEDRKTFAPLLLPFCLALQTLADCDDNKNINDALQALQGTEESTDFLKDCIGSHLLPLLSTVAKSHKADETRRLALEVLVSFAESRPKAMCKIPEFIQQVSGLCIQFLLDTGDDVQAWAAEEDDEEADDDEENVDAGGSAIDRVCESLNKVEKFPVALEALKPAIAQLFQAGEWKQVCAGIAVLQQIAEYIDDEDTVKQMVGAIQAQLRAANPRVRYAAWAAIAQFSQDHTEFMTGDTMAPQLLGEFLVGLDDSCSRVVQMCMTSFQHFGEGVEREFIEPCLQQMMEKLGQKLQTTKLPLQKKTITFIAVIAGQVEDAFAPYYGPLMPLLKQLALNLVHKSEERVLLGKIFECISLLAVAAGPEGFRADAESIMQAMVQATQVPNLPANDPVKEYMMAAAERICQSMKADFLPYVPHILPGVLEKFKCAPTLVGKDTKIDDGAEVNLTLIQEDGEVKVLIMNSSDLEDLKNALDCVLTFVKNLGKQFAPFVPSTSQALLPVFDFSMGEEIRDLAFETWGELCSVARDGGDAGILSQLVQEFLSRIFPKLEGADVDLEARKTRIDGVTACLRKAGPGVLSPEQVRHINQVVFLILEESIKRREEGRAKAGSTPAQADDEDADADSNDGEGEVMLRISCTRCVGCLMQHHADIFVSEGLPHCLTLVRQFLPKSAVEEDRRLALYVICDMFQHLASRVTSEWPNILPQSLQDISDPSVTIRVAACFAVSIAAVDPAFAPFAAETATKMAEIVTKSRSRTKKKSEKPVQECADNALSALLQMLVHHSQAVATASGQFWSVWLHGLPCQVDEVEGVKNHKALVSMVNSERAEVVGDGGSNLPRIVSILTEVYKTDMVDDETSTAIGLLFQKIGQAQLEQSATNLSDKLKSKLLRVIREAQQAVVPGV